MNKAKESESAAKNNSGVGAGDGLGSPGTPAVGNGSGVNTSLTQSPPPGPIKAFDRVKVFKYDGSLQCKMGKAISLTEMQKELNGITVHSSENKSDGLMRIQVCGSPTGRANVYEIDRSQLEAAIKLGFKEWTY